MAAPRLDAESTAKIAALKAGGHSRAEASRRLGIDRATVAKYWDAPRRECATSHTAPQSERPTAAPAARVAPRLPEPAPEAGGATLPEPITRPYEPYGIDGGGDWLVLCDVHIPQHDLRTIRMAVEEAKRRNVAGILLNGDILHFDKLGRHDPDPFMEEHTDQALDKGGQFLAWLRSQFPRARIVFKEGNHDWRWRSYLIKNAPELCKVAKFDLPAVLDLPNLGIEWVGGKRVIQLGKLPVVHGHEYRGGGGVMPARWLYLRSKSSAMCGHFHRTSEYHDRTLDERLQGVWSVGCACFLSPFYDPQSSWNHGYAIVTLEHDGGFSVANRRILRDGRVA